MDISHPFTLLPVAELDGHDSRAWHVAWNPQRPILASCSADKSVRLYRYFRHSPVEDDASASSFAFVHLTTIPTGHAKTVRAVAWSPSGRTLATASFDSNIGVWEQDRQHEGQEDKEGEWECVSLLEGHETECKSVAYSSGGNLLASCSRDKTVWIWEVHPDSDFECMGVLMEHTQDVKCVAWHPTEEILASASYDDTIKLFMDDPSDDWFCFDTLKGHTSTVWSVAFAPSGSHLASASDDRTIRIWARSAARPHAWAQVHVIDGAHDRSIYSVSWCRAVHPLDLHDGGGDDDENGLGQIASAGGDGAVCVWDIRMKAPDASAAPGETRVTTKLLTRLTEAHGVHDVNAAVWCPRDESRGLLATAGDDGRVRVWQLKK